MENKKEVLILINEYNYNDFKNNTYMIKGVLKMNNDNSNLTIVNTTDPISFATDDFDYEVVSMQKNSIRGIAVDKLFIDYTMDTDDIFEILYNLIQDKGISNNIENNKNVKYFSPNTMKIVDGDIIEFIHQKEHKYKSKIHRLEYSLGLINDTINQINEE